MITDIPFASPKAMIMEANKTIEKQHLWMLVAVDLLVRAYHETYDPLTATTYCANNYGSFQQKFHSY